MIIVNRVPGLLEMHVYAIYSDDGRLRDHLSIRRDVCRSVSIAISTALQEQIKAFRSQSESRNLHGRKFNFTNF